MSETPKILREMEIEWREEPVPMGPKSGGTKVRIVTSTGRESSISLGRDEHHQLKSRKFCETLAVKLLRELVDHPGKRGRKPKEVNGDSGAVPA